MADLPELENRVRADRERRGWSQAELAQRSGLSRAGVSAIESGRLVPSTAAALSLAAAFGCRVEDLFGLKRPAPEPTAWAWPPNREPARFWLAEVGGRLLRYPVEPSPLGMPPHDGVIPGAGGPAEGDPFLASRTLVLACCDPASGLLAAELARTAEIRLLVLPRSSGMALALLKQGLAHVAGLHLGRAGDDGHAEAIRSRLGPGFRLLRVARWQEGVAFAAGARPASLESALRSSRIRWVGREPGSGAQLCLEEILDGRPAPRRIARDHRGVAEAIRCGWADAGVCLRLAVEEAGLDFLPVREEAYDLCFPEALADDHRIKALLDAVRSAGYRRLLGELPGYDSAGAGEVVDVT